MTKLSVNINKIATLRNSRGGNTPNLVNVAVDVQAFGAQGITIHPRPDERHIRYQDAYDLKPIITTEYNIEGNPIKEFVDLVLAVKPTQVTLVPDAIDAITSNAGWNAGGPGAGIYGVSKGAVHTLTRALAKELAPAGIRVNAVSPGTIDTPFHAQIKETKPEVFASWKDSILLGRLGQPEEVASTISFLVSKDASFITAETIQIGGGQALGI